MTDQERSTRNDTGDSIERRLARLIASAEALCSEDEQRRDPLVEGAEERGLQRAHAELAYEIAVEERVPPAFGMAVVLQGISVQPLDGARPDVGASESAEPEWVDTPPEPADADRERRLRQTFRRLRSMLESAATPQAALEALAREPDLERYDY